MKTLADVIRDADQLSSEEQAGLATHLLSQMEGAPLGPDDEEVARRDAEIDAGTAKLITHDELTRAVGR